MPLKQPTDTTSAVWQWDATRSIWLQWNEAFGFWVVNHKPLPDWFIQSSGTIPASIFLRLWKQSTSWDELHQQVFWLSVSELKRLAEQLAFECRRCGVEPPEMFPSEVLSVTIPVSDWIEEGLVTPIEGVEVSTPSAEQTTSYDPMQALFDAQKNRAEQGLTDSRPFFQTVEQGKFTAKH